MIRRGDVDIDFANRTLALSVLEHIPASIVQNSKIEKHNTGVYFHAVPTDPVSLQSSVDYKQADEKGWFKIDILNVGVYEQVKSEKHLLDLIDAELDWSLFENSEFTSKLIHLGNYSDLLKQLKPKSLSDIAMVLAMIRPGKKHLIDKCKKFGFKSIEDEIWTDTNNQAYSFKKSHSFGYALLVKVHASLIVEQST